MEKIFKLVLTIMCVLPFSTGLDCFQCMYVKDFPLDIPGFDYPVTNKCEKKVPDDYKKTCSADSQILIDFTKNNASINVDDLTCVKLQAKLASAVVIFRGCIPKDLVAIDNPAKLGTCTSDNLQNLKEQFKIDDSILPDPVQNRQVNVDLCFCDGNGCNSALGIGPTKTLILLSLTSFIVIFSIIMTKL